MSLRPFRLLVPVLLAVAAAAYFNLVPALLTAWYRPRLAGPARPVRVIGHAGSGFTAPLLPFNPLPSDSWRGIAQALGRGAEGVEIDLQLSRDSVPVLYHDRSLRTLTARAGCVRDWPADTLTATPYRVGMPYDWFQHERPIRFDTLLQRLARRPDFPHLDLDLHEDDDCHPGHAPAYSAALLRAIGRDLRASRVPSEKVLLTSMHPATLQLARQLLPAVPRALEITDDAAFDFAGGLRAARQSASTAVVLSPGVATPAHVRQAQAAGRRVVLFGGRSAPGIRQQLELQPDAIETDNVPLLRRLLGRQ